MTTTPTDLYRHFDKDGRLLYVGISFRAIIRQAAHRNAAPWWDDVVTITVERFPSRKAALAAEKRAVEAEKPMHNKHWAEKKFRYKTKRSHGYTIELPGAPEMAEAVVDWYISLTFNRMMPKPLHGLAEKFDQSTEAGRGYSHAIKALEQLHADAKREAKTAPKPQRPVRVRKVTRRLGKRSGPDNLLEKLKKKDPKRLKALVKDVRDPAMSWRDLHRKYGYAVATLRRHFEAERKKHFAELAREDEKD